VTEAGSGLRRKVRIDLAASSAVNLPMTSAGLTIGCHLDGNAINPPHVFGRTNVAMIDCSQQI
jgi:hypothetical protein